MKPSSKIILHEPSWRIATREVEGWLTHVGGHLGPVTFTLGRRKVRPFHVAPWHGEKLPRGTPPIISVLRGDFFCMPFGGNGTVFGRERHPIHGETANSRWKRVGFDQSRDATRLTTTLQTTVRRGQVDKIVELRRGHSAIYQRHVISRMSGPMTCGHHAMLRFPDSGGIVSTSRFTFGSVYPLPTELAENRGYSILKPGAPFQSLERVPTVTGETTDLSRYPARRGYEDIALVASDTALAFAWTAVVFPKERYAWFALKDPAVLASTLFWFSNGGRHYPPWNGRHVNVLGLEEVTSAFHPGLAESVQPNLLSERGIRTFIRLDPKRPTVVNYIMAAAEVPGDFGRVTDIVPGDGEVTLIGEHGGRVTTSIDLSWLRGGA